MKCTCGNTIPEKRLQLGYKTCVECSTEEKWSAIPIIYHKTGNTVQVIKDPEVAKEMIALSKRTGFGTMRGMKPQQKSMTYSPKNVKNAQNLLNRAPKTDPEKFERIGREAMEIYEYEGKERASQWLKKKAENLSITFTEMNKIQTILKAMFERETEKVESKNPESKWWYSKRERPEEKKEVSEDIDYVFKNWKR